MENSEERHDNYRLALDRRVVENIFGILAVVLGVRRKPMLLQPNKVLLIVLACSLLHHSEKANCRHQNTYQGASIANFLLH